MNFIVNKSSRVLFCVLLYFCVRVCLTHSLPLVSVYKKIIILKKETINCFGFESEKSINK